MSALDTFHAIVSNIAYKPGWEFHVFKASDHHFLQVRFLACDPRSGKEEWQSGRKWFLSEHMTKGEVVQTCFMAVQVAEEHAAREVFTYCGEAIFGPHFNITQLVTLCRKPNATEVRP